MNEGFIDAPGGKVWYKITGDGDETPLLCLYGGPSSARYRLEPLEALDRRQLIENASHPCFAEQLVEFTVRVNDFLDRTDDAASRQVLAR